MWQFPSRPAFHAAAGAMALVLGGAADGWAQPAGGGPQAATASQAAAVQQAVVGAIARAERSVVAIAGYRKAGRQERVGIFELERSFFDPEKPRRPGHDPLAERPAARFATGVAIEKGRIVTCYHALGDPRAFTYRVWWRGQGAAAKVQARPARVLAGDPWSDLAVLETDHDIPPVALGEAEKLRKGTFVIALGNPYAIARDGEPSAAWGIIANLRRVPAVATLEPDGAPRPTSLHHYGTLLQTDARLELGTSGGALVDLDGRLVGVTTALSALSGRASDAGFAIPVDRAFRSAIEKLSAGHVPTFGFLGIQPDELSDRERRLIGDGVRVVRVLPGTPASRSAIAVGDVITHVGRSRVRNWRELIRAIAGQPPGSTVPLTVDRTGTDPADRRQLTVEVVLGPKAAPLSGVRPYEAAVERMWRGLKVDFCRPSDIGGQAAEEGGVLVAAVERNSPAWQAGLRVGARIVSVERDRVRSPAVFHQQVARERGSVRLTVVQRQASPRRVEVPPADRDEGQDDRSQNRAGDPTR